MDDFAMVVQVSKSEMRRAACKRFIKASARFLRGRLDENGFLVRFVLTFRPLLEADANEGRLWRDVMPNSVRKKLMCDLSLGVHAASYRNGDGAILDMKTAVTDIEGLIRFGVMVAREILGKTNVKKLLKKFKIASSFASKRAWKNFCTSLAEAGAWLFVDAHTNKVRPAFGI